ncbi:hypothetical protein [Defluviimonas sp. WL0075]|uniref:5-carboxymethyl-2-hydroxymuconate isomerase n=1 Tax=Albidovulum sediminicola TaxID=2984331 RepID=A0ABT2YW70_9RHOB|nr:hypothetical protein [Defluviimonas sp. WL0075]MCV2863119.1 hypothetical protein [Defluviimonas sp. WL0075]
MPVAQIIVAPHLARTISAYADRISADLKAALVEGLSTDPRLVQVTITAALCPPEGCETLCLVHHRAADSRTQDIRKATARQLHDILREATNATVRVRLIATEPSHIAACDSPEALS